VTTFIATIIEFLRIWTAFGVDAALNAIALGEGG